MNHAATPKDEKWLTLREAASRLSVHPSTLRRWADEGQIPVMLTPGGHRRFAESAVDDLARSRHSIRQIGPAERVWASEALDRTRKEIMESGHQQWLAKHDDEARSAGRVLGQQLMALMLDYLTSETGEEKVAEARSIGRRYAENSKRVGLPLTDALQASMFFRDAVIRTALTLPDNVRIPKTSQIRMINRINTLLDAVLLGVADAYAE